MFLSCFKYSFFPLIISLSQKEKSRSEFDSDKHNDLSTKTTTTNRYAFINYNKRELLLFIKKYRKGAQRPPHILPQPGETQSTISIIPLSKSKQVCLTDVFL
jgi:hypothetical protein